MARWISAELRQTVADRAKQLCEYCLIAEADTFYGCEVDHIISLKHDGGAEKFSGKFDVFRFKRFTLEPEHDVNASLQVMSGRRHNLSAFIHNLQRCDRLKLFDSLASILF